MQCESVAPRASRLGAFIKGIDYGACGSCFIDGSFPTVCLSPERCRGSGSPLVGPLCRSVCVNYRSEFGKRESSHGSAPSWVKWTPASTFRDPGKRGVGGIKSVDYGACGSCIDGSFPTVCLPSPTGPGGAGPGGIPVEVDPSRTGAFKVT